MFAETQGAFHREKGLNLSKKSGACGILTCAVLSPAPRSVEPWKIIACLGLEGAEHSRTLSKPTPEGLLLFDSFWGSRKDPDQQAFLT